MSKRTLIHEVNYRPDNEATSWRYVLLTKQLVPQLLNKYLSLRSIVQRYAQHMHSKGIQFDSGPVH